MTKLVFTNGCFDVVHIGHIRLLEFCATLGSEVFVGLNSDASIRRLKGPSRPVNNENDRLKLLQSIKYVTHVEIFDEDTPLRLIERVRPDIVVKGGDYAKDDVVGKEFADVVIFPTVPGISSSQILQKLNK